MATKKENDENTNDPSLYTNEALLSALDEGEIEVQEMADWTPPIFEEDKLKSFVRGEITWAQLQGLTMEEAYSFAEMGYTLFQQGQYKQAKSIFEGLVLCNPYDPYFHSMLGAIYARQDLFEEAAHEYTVVLELDPENIISLVSRAEILLQSGDFEPAMKDLARAIELDPEGEDPSGLRARALAGATAAIIRDVIEQRKAEKKK